MRLMRNRGTRTVAELASELGVSDSMLNRWNHQYGAEVSGGPAKAEGQREDVEKLRRRLRELEMENAPLSDGPLRQGREIAVFELVHAERDRFPVAFSCRVLGVSRSGYYRWRQAPRSARQASDARLSADVGAIHREHKGRYGS